MPMEMTHPRVLLLYPEFPPSYWNTKFLGSASGRTTMAPPLGLLTVAALLPEAWQLKLVDENVQALTTDDWDWAEVVFLSALFIQRRRLRELITMARDRGKKVVVGGPYPTVHTQEVLATGADLVVRGEFENLLAPFWEAFQAGHAGVVLESADRPSLADSPVPRFDLLRLNDYAMMVFQTTRGCPFDCEFCDVVRLFGRKPRHKSQEQVLAEMEALYRLGWRREILIGDDNFIGNRSYARDLLNRMIPWHKSHGEPFNFFAQTSVNLGQELELIDLMTEANFATVFIGIESPDEEVLKSANKHQNVRHPQSELIKTIIANGLNIMGSFVLGFDNEGKGAGERIAAFVEATNIPNSVINLLFPFPYTRLWERLKQEGRLREDRLLDDSQDLDIFCRPLAYQPTRPEPEILQEYMDLWERLYERGTFLDRTYRFCLAMRPTRGAQAESGKGAPQPCSPMKGKPWGTIFSDLKHFIRISWAYGVRPACRRRYWRYLFDIRRRNPSRLVRFLRNCSVGEGMMHLRDVVRERMQSYLKEAARSVPGANLEEESTGLE
jgi:radical SAM superfamily enzyme YgiQ (UPF0313 family)